MKLPVMPTREPRMPLMRSDGSNFPLFLMIECASAYMPPPNEAKIVMKALRAAYSHFAPLKPYVEPELNANQPHQRKKRPTQALTGFPICGALAPLSYRCSLGPSIMPAARADAPPSRCTGPLPAISTQPSFLMKDKSFFYSFQLTLMD
jgi:hypothetical protein